MSSEARAKRAGLNRMRIWAARATEAMESQLWPLPVAAVMLAVIVGIVVPSIDLISNAHLPTGLDSLVFGGGAEAARALLSTIAGSLMTVTSLTFSLTVVALQLASSQASPRVLRLFARDRYVHATLAVFLGTFAYSITVLRSVRTATNVTDEFVPRIAVTAGFVLTLVSVVMLVLFLAHLATQLRVETILKDVHAETDRTIDLVSDTRADASAFTGEYSRPALTMTITSSSSGFITSRDRESLIELAADHGVVIQERKSVGDNVVVNTPLVLWWVRAGVSTTPDAKAIAAGVQRAHTIGYERTAAQDFDYGVQQIVEIGVRALSPGVNDPATAVHALGHLSALVARIVAMPPVPEAVADSNGELALITKTAKPAEIVDGALALIRHYGAGDPSLVRRFLQLIDDLQYTSDDPAVRSALLHQLAALDEQLAQDGTDPAAVAALRVAVEETTLAVKA